MNTVSPEKREGKSIVRFYVPEELQKQFREYCSFKNTSMTAEFCALMRLCVADPNFQEYLETKQRLQGRSLSTAQQNALPIDRQGEDSIEISPDS